MRTTRMASVKAAVMCGVMALGLAAPVRAQSPIEYFATNRTSTMQKELASAAAQGYEYVGQTVFESLFGGSEVVVIAERNPGAEGGTRHEYLLVATSKTSTLQKELAEAGGRGFEVVGMTVGKTALGGAELVAITRRLLPK